MFIGLYNYLKCSWIRKRFCLSSVWYYNKSKYNCHSFSSAHYKSICDIRTFLSMTKPIIEVVCKVGLIEIFEQIIVTTMYSKPMMQLTQLIRFTAVSTCSKLRRFDFVSDHSSLKNIGNTRMSSKKFCMQQVILFSVREMGFRWIKVDYRLKKRRKAISGRIE